MAHFRCPTFNSLNARMPNRNRLTLASHNQTSRRSFSISPLQGFSAAPAWLLPSRRHDEGDDFQSNARVVKTESTHESGLHLAGLGITYPQRYANAGFLDLMIPPEEVKYQPPTVLQGQKIDAFPSSQGDPSGLQGRRIIPPWSLPSIISATVSEPVNSKCLLGQNVSELRYLIEDDLNHPDRHRIPPSWSSQNSSELQYPSKDDLNCPHGRQLPPSSSLSLSSLSSEADDSKHLLNQGATLQYPQVDIKEMTFDSLAAASGMRADVLAVQLSTTADLALQYIEKDSLRSFTMSATRSTGSLLEELLDDGPPAWRLSPNSGGDATPGLRVKAEMRNEPSLGINPVEVTSGTLYQCGLYLPSESSAISRVSFASLESFYPLEEFFPKEERPKDHQFPASLSMDIAVARTLDSEEDLKISKNRIAYHDVILPIKLQDNNSDYVFSDVGHSSRSTSPFPSPRQKKRGQKAKRLTKLRSTRPPRPTILPMHALTPLPPVKREEPLFDLNLGTPVLDAHRGIDLDELREKAMRYRKRNPGRIYENGWLVSFAGKLSNCGELVKDFRCYIFGCNQTNKRRDHILIHVGSHLDQRPFSPSSFFRKNECKRHELSHSGEKPFACLLCPGTAFVRQDLLKRHTTRAHGAMAALVPQKRKEPTAKVKKERGDKENFGARLTKRVKRECAADLMS
ncbi:hypothetical protein DXG03_003505 [Asterophora parasitica]|uniref:C2H2-type domain-containing protein n=1 Tax=Asterophora parasitica TaxID=117018 RepID=A0A9P7KF36_9AGAR|nr:hypothetical protein DXG03_003505 [Asterophora parasitica]